ncbi:MAG: hypothetical protein A2086_02705 [Spirochaetes bacterium GWD1_27_9]|nr:MAG: hypothetical protein A2Z98_14595 [Spirochaetes bacterium GWB1_27_13]OHD26769.1 MAG: hypothetical protein A2Y34_02950 [Spirochaetes bacterium GWC1_27_15]OHD31536.1 MAG: hypothetical protein A2086_02705 [Spirochaetes bacterium GWD1_27_9]
MKFTIILMSVLSVMFLFMHEFDACYRKEWKMFKFLRNFNENTQYLIFLYIHIPITLFLLYYLWTVINFNNIILWIIVNVFFVLHLVIHLIARKWKSNVFTEIHSFIFIVGAAITSFINLFLVKYY